MDKYQRLANALDRAGVPYTINESLKTHTTFKIGGPAACFCTPANINQLKDSISLAKGLEIPFHILGLGSNTLFSDDGYGGMIICLTKINANCDIQGDILEASAGSSLSEICLKAQKKGLSGLEFAYGIPGTLGGAIYMNAGAYDGEMSQVVTDVAILDEDMNERIIPSSDAGFGYRTSVFQASPWIVLSARMKLYPDEPSAIWNKMRTNMESRKAKQPLESPSAGSTFKRPEGAFAGALIEKCGLRGYRVGGAAISEKHCGFVVNLGGATCVDIMTLTDHVAKTVLERTGFQLEKEIRIIKT